MAPHAAASTSSTNTTAAAPAVRSVAASEDKTINVCLNVFYS